jgi:hypothetical protein
MTPRYFPRHTQDWRIEKPSALRRLSFSLVEMAIITGIAVRLLRSIALSYDGGILYLGATFALGVAILFGMLAAHLANYTLRTWVWRVPGFAALEAFAELATSAVLIALQREPLGSRERAEFGDLPQVMLGVIQWRMIPLIVFAIVLGGVVYAVRYWLISRERDEDAAEAVRAELDEPEPVVEESPGS